MFLAALALRPQIVAVGPLIDGIQDDLDASHAVAGLLGTIPLLCMGLFAPVAVYVAQALGTRRAMTLGLSLIGVFGMLRALAPSAWLIVLLTVGVGVGMGIGNSLAPLAVRESVPERPATGTGVYTTGIQLGSTIAAAIAVPLAGLLGGWRGALIAVSAVSFAIALSWAVLERRDEEHVRPARLFPRLPWRSRTAWLLVAIFAGMGSTYFGLLAWLPDAYVEYGWSERSAGFLLAAMNLTAIPCSFLVPWLSDKYGGRRPWLAGTASLFVASVVGLATVPAAGYAWALLVGVAQGGTFALVMTLPLDFGDTRERVGALVGLMLGVGYSVVSLSPFALGALRDETGSYDVVLWACASLAGVMVVLVNLLPRPGGVAAASGGYPGG